MPCLLSVNNRYSCLIKANESYGKNGEGRENFLSGGGGGGMLKTVHYAEAELGFRQHLRQEFFVAIANNWKPLTVFGKYLILDVRALDLPLLVPLLQDFISLGHV